MTPQQFVNALMPYARQVQTAYGLDPWAILCQWADETGWGSSTLFVSGHNVAGVTHTDPNTHETVFSTYASLQAGVTDYIRVLGLSYYTGVRATAGQPVPATLTALGESPWDAGHYGSPPGSALQNIWTNLLQPLSGETAGLGDATSLFSPLWTDTVGLERATGAPYVAAPWAGAQKLSGEHLGTVPSVAEGANYLAGTLQSVALFVGTGMIFAGTGTAPAGSLDPAATLGPVYVGLAHVAQALRTGLLGLPWAAAQGLQPDHWGHPPDLDSGVAYLDGQVQALTRHAQGIVSTPPPPAGGGTATGGGGSATSPPASTGGPLPVPPPSSGSGQAGLESAWSALMTLLGTTLPAAADAVAAELSKATGGTYNGPH